MVYVARGLERTCWSCALATAAARDSGVPSPCVIDVGLTRDRGWLVMEANAAWGAGLNGCDAVAAARCIARALVAAFLSFFAVYSSTCRGSQM